MKVALIFQCATLFSLLIGGLGLPNKLLRIWFHPCRIEPYRPPHRLVSGMPDSNDLERCLSYGKLL
jgi:hypothetical protein